MAHAQTGSGKVFLTLTIKWIIFFSQTAAFLLPIINDIQRTIRELSNQNTAQINRDSPYCIILSPTKELGEQLYEDVKTFATRMHVIPKFWYQKIFLKEQKSQWPGHMVDLIFRKKDFFDIFLLGDMPFRSTMEFIQKGCDILVLTCGRLRHHILSKHVWN